MRDGDACDSSELSRRARRTDPKDVSLNALNFATEEKKTLRKEKQKRTRGAKALVNKTQADRSRESVNTWIRTVIHTCVERFERHNEGTSWGRRGEMGGEQGGSE